MPRGSNPNSIKALEQNRHKGSFNTETAVKAKQKSDAAKAEQKRLRECLDELLSMEHTYIDGNTYTGAECVALALFKRALHGNIRAFEVIRDTVGEKPIEKMNVYNAKPSIDIMVEFDGEMVTPVEHLQRAIEKRRKERGER